VSTGDYMKIITWFLDMGTDNYYRQVSKKGNKCDLFGVTVSANVRKGWVL
jgi:hypothetical protein